MKFKRLIPNLFLILVISYFLFLIHPVFFGQLGGTFKQREVSGEYIALKNKLYKDPGFYRTLWVPRQQRFTYSSSSHPSIEANPLFKATDAASLAKQLHDKNAEEYVSKLGIKYIIIPFDPYGEIFIDDRKYSQKKRDEYEKVLDKVTWLKKIDCSIAKLLNCSESPFGKITIYETRKHKDHFWLENPGKVSYTMLKQYHYKVIIDSPKENTLVFSENFHPHWQLSYYVTLISPQKTKEGLQAYAIPSGKHAYELVFIEQQWYLYGLMISLPVILLLLSSLIVLKYKEFFIYLKNSF